MKLKESIPSNSVKIIELYNKIDSGILDTSPDFQRKLVWKKQHKYHFIDTILLNFPFPEIYIASAEMDVESLTAKEIVVDGKQRLTAIMDYIKGINDFENQTKVTPFSKLLTEDKKDFLNYLVTVKDLKNIDRYLITEIFQRINSTEYSLNSIEKTNAQYGDGEFAVFCKQIVDSSYNPTNDTTDIIINKETKSFLNKFFTDNNIFSNNDRSRMYDNQYIMLIVSTFLEGGYFSRSTKIIDYLEKYNSSFENYSTPLGLLENSINIISSLGFNEKSYWLNQANLFTLIIELSKIKKETLDIDMFELALRDMEQRMSRYFADEDLSIIGPDEKKYFEMARQGSHEKAARVHRGEVISKLIDSCLNVKHVVKNNCFNNRIKILNDNNINYTTIEPTKTGLSKSIIDATQSIRTFLADNNIHDYDKQSFGTDFKKEVSATFILEDKTVETKVSLYRANTRGDSRIWITCLNEYAKSNDVIALINKNNHLYILNITQLSIEKLVEGDNNPLKKYLSI